MRFGFHATLLFCSVIVSLQPSSAALIYELGFDQSNYTSNPGDLVTVGVFIRETATAGETLRLAPLGKDGLFTVGFRIDYGTATSANGSFVPDSTNSSRVTLNPAFDDTTTREQSDSGDILRIFAGTVDIDEGISTAPVENVATLPIATIQFTASSNVGDVTTLQLLDFSSTANTVFVNGFSPDDTGTLLFGTSSISVAATAVPEPSSIVAIGVLGSAVLIRRSRRKHLLSGAVQAKPAS